MDFIPVSKPYLLEDDKCSVLEAISNGWVSSAGPVIKQFEQSFSDTLGTDYRSVACSNGTAALEAAIYALDLPCGSEVIIPTFTIASCAFACIRNNLKPVPIDCDITLNMDAEKLLAAITNATSAIMIVHIYGLSPNCLKIKQIAQSYKLKVIEDCSESVGTIVQENLCGTYGDVSTFSFYANKHLTTGEGGLVATTSELYERRVRQYINLCFGESTRFKHENVGCNYRMTSMQAALGLSQLKRVNSVIEAKKRIALRYIELIREYGLSDLLYYQPLKAHGTENSYWVFSIILKTSDNSTSLMQHLASRGIGSREFFYPMHLQPFMQSHLDSTNPQEFSISESIFRKGLYIPSFVELEEKLMICIVREIHDFLF